MKTLILISICFLLVGCATSSYTGYTVGKDFDSSLVNQIVKKKTTGAEILQMFGQPSTKTVISENEEKWIYTYTSGHAKVENYIITMDVKTEGQMKTLDILLRDGIVINYTYNEGPMPGSLQTK